MTDTSQNEVPQYRSVSPAQSKTATIASHATDTGKRSAFGLIY